MPTDRRLACAFLLVALGAFWALAFDAAGRMPEFSFWGQFLSRLGFASSPPEVRLRFLLALLGVAAALPFYAWRSAPVLLRGGWIAAGRAFGVVAAAGCLVVGVFPYDTHRAAHMAGVVLALLPFLILFARLAAGGGNGAGPVWRMPFLLLAALIATHAGQGIVHFAIGRPVFAEPALQKLVLISLSLLLAADCLRGLRQGAGGRNG